MNQRMILVALLYLSFSSLAGAGNFLQFEPSYNRQYADVTAFITQVASQYNSVAQEFSLGMSNYGVEIKGLKIGSGPVHNLLVATHHGNEYGSTEVAMAFALALAQNPIPDETVFVIPVLNISGYNSLNRRETANGTTYDPNRDYPGPCGTEGPFILKSTKALADFIDKENIVATATLHTYWPVVAYPWGISTQQTSTPYDDTFIKLAQAATQESHYEVGNSTLAIYPADGTYEDYSFWKHGIWSLLFELGNSHTPNPDEVAEMIRVNVPGLRRMMELAPKERAAKHEFTGQCNQADRFLDRHDE